MTNQPDLYVNDPPSGMKSHLFRGEDVRAATLVDGTTDDPVKSACGTVRSYGPFAAADDVTGEDVCENCTNKTSDSDR